jgi:hypothetical protein
MKVTGLLLIFFVSRRLLWNQFASAVPIMCKRMKWFIYNKTNQIHQFPKFTPAWNSTRFGQFLCPSSGVYSLYTRHWYMSYRFEDSFQAGLGWAEELPETCRVSCRSKVGKLVHLVGFIIKKHIHVSVTSAFDWNDHPLQTQLLLLLLRTITRHPLNRWTCKLKRLSGCNDPGNRAPAEDEGFNIKHHDPPQG